MLYITLLALAVYVLAEIKSTSVKKLKIIMISLIIMVFLAAFMLLPELEILKYSTRPLKDFSYATTSSLTLPNLITIIVPHFWGFRKLK